MIFSHLPAGLITTYLSRKLWRRRLTSREIYGAWIIGAVAGILPDIDIFYYYFIDSRLSHRELITHTPWLYLIILPWFFLVGFWRRNDWWRALGVVISCAIGSHLLLDSLTSGIGWFYPYSDLLYGLLSWPVLATGFYGRHLFVFTLTGELLIWLIALIILIFARVKNIFWRGATLALAVFLTVGWSLALVKINQHLFIKDARVYYSDQDRDGLANKNDDDLDGDGEENFADADANNNGRNNREEIVAVAETMPGVYYDPTNKGYGALLTRLGFLSNLDVVLKSYETAGIFLGREMERDFQEYPQSYRTVPANDDFTNSAYHLYVFCRHQNLLVAPDQPALAGDVVFYGDRRVTALALVVVEGKEPAVVVAGANSQRVMRVQNVAASEQLGEIIAYGRILR